MGSGDVKLQYTDDDPDSYSNIFNNAKTDVSKADQNRLIQALKKLNAYEDIEDVVDVDEVIRYFVVHNYVCNGDSYTGSIIHNYYLHESDGKLSMIPWDYNLAFGTFRSSDAMEVVNDPIDTPMEVSDASDRPMWGWIVSSEEYTALYHQYFAEFLDNVDITGIIDEAYALIKPYVEKDPTAFCTDEEFEIGVETLRTFCALRSESVRGQLEGTVPSTAAGQREDSSGLVEADGISISAMGSMGAAEAAASAAVSAPADSPVRRGAEAGAKAPANGLTSGAGPPDRAAASPAGKTPERSRTSIPLPSGALPVRPPGRTGPAGSSPAFPSSSFWRGWASPSNTTGADKKDSRRPKASGSQRVDKVLSTR